MKRPGVLSILITAAVILPVVIILGLLVYGVLNTGDDTSLDAAVKRGDQPSTPGQTVALKTLDGSRRAALRDYRGKVVVLNFWASWCEPCQAEAPILERAQRRLQQSGKGTVLGVTYKDFADESRKFERRLGITYPSLRDDELELAPKFGTNKLPETFVINPGGKIVAISRGQLDQAFLDNAIARASGGST